MLLTPSQDQPTNEQTNTTHTRTHAPPAHKLSRRFRILLGIDPAVSLPPQTQTLLLWPAVAGLALVFFHAAATQDLEVIRGAVAGGGLLALVASDLVFQGTMKRGWMTGAVGWAATALLAVHVAAYLTVNPFCLLCWTFIYVSPHRFRASVVQTQRSHALCVASHSPSPMVV